VTEPLGNPETQDGEGLIETFPYTLRSAGILILQSACEILQQAARGRDLAPGIRAIEDRSDPRSLPLWQMFQHIPPLMDLTPLNQRRSAKHVADRAVQGFRSIQNDQETSRLLMERLDRVDELARRIRRRDASGKTG